MDTPAWRAATGLRTHLWKLRWELGAVSFALVAWWVGPLLWPGLAGRAGWSALLWLLGSLLFLGMLLLRLRSLRKQLSAELTAHDREKRALGTHEAQSEALLNVLPDLTFRLDVAGNVSSLGGAAARGRQLVPVRTLSELVPEQVARQLLECARDVSRTGKLGRREYQLREQSELSDFEARIAGEGERPLMVMIRDVTQRKRLERDLIAAREGALAAARVKTKFLANMSHEIRTPMNGVIGMTNLLLETPLSVEQQEYANIIQKSGQALLAIIDDILDFAKIEAGKLELEDVDFDLFACVDESLEAVASQADAKRLELGAVFAPGLSANVRGDPTRLRQVLANLLNNAVRYTERGAVQVYVGKASGDGSLLEFAVQDSGPGIGEEAQRTLFHPVLLGEGTRAASGGAGLGLAIARELVQLMGGEMTCETKLGEGSVFRFNARLVARDSGRNSLDPSLFQDALAQVLLLGAAHSAHWPVADQLAALGAKSQRVTPEQLASALRPEPGGLASFCVLIDERLEPGLVSRTLAQLRDDPALEQTSLLVVACPGDPKLAELRAQATRVIGWPVRQTELFACLSALLSRAQSTRASEQSPAPVRATPRVLIADDDPISQRVLQRLLEQLGFASECVGDGAHALEKLAAARFDVVLMDCQMPWMDGFEAARRIRTQEQALGRRTCIVAMTASNADEDRRSSREAQMDGFLTKPVSLEQLHDELARAQRESAEPRFDTGRLDGLRLSRASSDGVVKAAIERFLEQAPRNLDAMRAALDVGDFAAVAKAAHNLESSSAYLGALRLSRLSFELEQLTRGERVASVERGLESVSAELDIVRRELSARQSAT
jgi:two-component system, sensor histidine kinase and response regulator